MMKDVDAETPVKYLSSVGSAEMNYFRPSFTSAYSVINKMSNVLEEAKNWYYDEI